MLWAGFSLWCTGQLVLLEDAVYYPVAHVQALQDVMSVMQDAEAFHQSLLHPSAWYKLKDGPSEEEA